MNNSIKHEVVKRRVIRYFNSNQEEVTFSHGKGAYVFDNFGNKYLDCVLGYGPVVLGHSNNIFNTKISNFLSNGIHMPGFTDLHDKYLEHLLSKHENLTSSILSVFMKTSSESVTGAIRIASIETNRKGVLRCGFSGWHDSQHAYSPSWHMPPKHRGKLRNIDGLRGVSNDEKVFNWQSLDLNDLSSLLKKNGSKIACFIFDAFQLSFIDINILNEAINLCKSYGIVIVIDETKTAGRVSPFGAIATDSSLWDMVVLGKAIGNGTPLSMLLVKEEYGSSVKDARIGGTHSKELLSVQCALSTLEIMDKSNGYEKIGKAGTNLSTLFNNIALEIGIANLIESKPLFGGGLLDIVFNDKMYKNSNYVRILQNIFLDNKILHLVGHPSFVSLAHYEIDEELIKADFYKSLLSWSNKIHK